MVVQMNQLSAKRVGKNIVVALSGNPNSGKSTIFNNLTGARQHVANYPGVTVETKEGQLNHNGNKFTIVDLPGAYSLNAYSKEELNARNYLLNSKPDMIVNVVDMSNLERNLYLALQLMELGIPIILVFNQSDLAKRKGCFYNIDKIASFFNVRIIETVGNKNIGTSELIEAISDELLNPHVPFVCKFSDKIEAEIASIMDLLGNYRVCGEMFTNIRWLAMRLLENDEEIKTTITNYIVDFSKIFSAVDESRSKIKGIYKSLPELVMPNQRYSLINNICADNILVSRNKGKDFSDKIDSVVLSKIFGIPIFLFMMFCVFQLTFTLGAPLMDLMETFFGMAGSFVSMCWVEGSDSVLRSLIVDGIIGGVGGVMVFLPNILLLFLALSFLEDSGYMARVAFLMDKIMSKIGLHGKSFIPMLTGFGCSVPGIMATRTLEHEHDRLTTMLVLPLISCGARLPIYLLLIPAFFRQDLQAPILWLIYLMGVVIAIICAKALRKTLFKGDQAVFFLELPPYRIPTIKGTLIHMWQKCWMYLRKAGTLILGLSIILWAITSFPKPPEKLLQGLSENEVIEKQLEYSLAGRIGKIMEPAIKPLSFDWKIGTALIGALAAKEVFVAQLGIVYAIAEADEESKDLRAILNRKYTPLTAFCIMVFCLISAPCLATFAVTKKESGSWKWAFFQFFGLTFLAYIITFAVYQLGRIFGFGG